ncbi:MAG TPA: GNAT family N-acetyltransferase [Acidimicrobiales bacterium]
MRVKVATAEDLAAVLTLDRHAAAGDAERIAYLERWVPSGHCLVHEGDGVIDGYVVVRPQHFYARDFIDLLFVREASRRHGIGRALIQAALQGATTGEVFTSTNRSNLPMQGLLRDLGWRCSGELTGLDEDDSELVYFTARQPSA